MPRDIITLDDLTRNNKGTFKKINEVSLPTKYSDSWYDDALTAGNVVQLAFYTELPVGAIKGKLVNSSHTLPTFEDAMTAQLNSKIVPNAIYIESFAVLQAYRSLGIGTRLLNWLVEQAKERYIHQLLLHVHVDNKEAVAYYEKFGFTSSGIAQDYYKNQGLQNPHAVILSYFF